MKLKYVAASKLLLSNWSIPKLGRTRADRHPSVPLAGLCQSQQHQGFLCADGTAQRAACQGCPGDGFGQYQPRCIRRQPVDCLSRIHRSAPAAQLLIAVRPVLPVLRRAIAQRRHRTVQEALSFYTKYLAQPLYESYIRFFSMLAIKASVYILAGTTIVRTREGLVNRAFLFDPDGTIILQQDKLHLSPQEKLCGILPGKELQTVPTKLCRISVLTGMQSAFLKLHGLPIRLAPSCCCVLLPSAPAAAAPSSKAVPSCAVRSSRCLRLPLG